MSTAFIPDTGSFFYVEAQPYDVVVSGGLFGQTTVIKQQDRSYLEDVFLCTGRDDRTAVGKCLTSAWLDKPVVFHRKSFTFFPVGPDVVKALGLSSQEQQT
jgi:hypothetical protein